MPTSRWLVLPSYGAREPLHYPSGMIVRAHDHAVGLSFPANVITFGEDSRTWGLQRCPSSVATPPARYAVPVVAAPVVARGRARWAL